MAAVDTATQGLVNKFTDVIVNPILALIFTAGLLLFIFGIVEFMWGLSTAAEGKEKGKQHMLWGLIGMFIMVGAWGILRLLVHTVGYTPGVHI
jgi:uncharacterized membrane protein YidH (DUF202 family)